MEQGLISQCSDVDIGNPSPNGRLGVRLSGEGRHVRLEGREAGGGEVVVGEGGEPDVPDRQHVVVLELLQLPGLCRQLMLGEWVAVAELQGTKVQHQAAHRPQRPQKLCWTRQRRFDDTGSRACVRVPCDSLVIQIPQTTNNIGLGSPTPANST